jgi:hypothetical protein
MTRVLRRKESQREWLHATVDVLFDGPEVDESRYELWTRVVNDVIGLITWDFVEVEQAPAEVGGVRVVTLEEWPLFLGVPS